jgi:hypothetical protein
MNAFQPIQTKIAPIMMSVQPTTSLTCSNGRASKPSPNPANMNPNCFFLLGDMDITATNYSNEADGAPQILSCKQYGIEIDELGSLKEQALGNFYFGDSAFNYLTSRAFSSLPSPSPAVSTLASRPPACARSSSQWLSQTLHCRAGGRWFRRRGW